MFLRIGEKHTRCWKQLDVQRRLTDEPDNAENRGFDHDRPRILGPPAPQRHQLVHDRLIGEPFELLPV